MAITNEELGQRLKELREKKGLNQTEFGVALGVNQSTVSRLEDGSRALTARELAAASAAFGVSLNQLVELEDPAVSALLRATETDDEAVEESLRVFNECIDEFRGVEALAG